MREPQLLSEVQRQQRRRRFQRWCRQLAELDWLCQGSLIQVSPTAWRWTRKRQSKTVTVAVSRHQAALLSRAIAQQRKAEELLSHMRQLSEEVVLRSAPGVRRRHRQKTS